MLHRRARSTGSGLLDLFVMGVCRADYLSSADTNLPLHKHTREVQGFSELAIYHWPRLHIRTPGTNSNLPPVRTRLCGPTGITTFRTGGCSSVPYDPGVHREIATPHEGGGGSGHLKRPSKNNTCDEPPRVDALLFSEM